MFIGHFAVGFACKRLAPRASLGALMAAPLFLDLLWPLFLIAGLESVRIDPGNTAFTPLDLLLAAIYSTTVFGPPPPSVEAIKYVGVTSWLFVPWAWWIDRNRTVSMAVADAGS
jgi:hypothetical protein